MKKLLLFFILALPLISCKKDPDIPVVAGDWDVTFTTAATGGTSNHGVLSITQDGSNLTGTFTWAGKVSQLLSNSTVSSVVAIYWDTYIFAGSVSGVETMSGDVYNFDYFDGQYNKTGTWEAIRK